MTINLIGVMCALSMDNRLYLGKDNDLLFKFKEDQEYFKMLTIGNICYMGYNTYKSLPEGKLPGRTIVVLTKNHYDEFENKKLFSPNKIAKDSTNNTYAYKSLDDLLYDIENDDEIIACYNRYSAGIMNLYCCGGAEIYKNLLYTKRDYNREFYITLVTNQSKYNSIDLKDSIFIPDFLRSESIRIEASITYTSEDDPDIEYRKVHAYLPNSKD